MCIRDRKLQAQINELLEEVDKNLEKVADLDLDGLCADSGRITAGMDLLVPRYRAFAVLMEELGDMQQALLAGGAANQFAVDVQKIRRDCATRVAAPSTQPGSSVSQATDKPVSEVEDMALRQVLRRALQNSLQLLTQPRPVHHLNLNFDVNPPEEPRVQALGTMRVTRSVLTQLMKPV